MFGRSLEEKREYLAKVAAEVFLAKGYKEASLQNIATEAKISKAGIYHYFKTKEEILYYIILRYTEQVALKALQGCLDLSVQDHWDPERSLEELIKTYLDTTLKHRTISLLVLRERHQLTGEYQIRLTQLERKIFRMLRDQLEKVQKKNGHVNLNLASFQIISTIHWMGYWFDENGPLTMEEAINQLIDIMFHGIL